MTFAITGATSMLGLATIKACIPQKIQVLALVRKNSPRIARLPQSPFLQIIECDLSEMASLDAAGLSADVFIHFGWTHTDKAGRNDVCKQLENVRFTIDAVHLAKRLGCKKFIGAGSQAEYGTPNIMLKATTPVNPLVPYGVAKYAAGRLARLECTKKSLEYNWVRVLSVYGKNDREETLVSQLVHNAKNNVPMGLSGCEQIWSFLHEDDAGRAFLAIAEKGVSGKIYPLGSGIGRPLKDFVFDVVAMINPDYKAEIGKFGYSPAQPMYLVADVSELVSDTGWKPLVSFADGIRGMRKEEFNIRIEGGASVDQDITTSVLLPIMRWHDVCYR